MAARAAYFTHPSDELAIYKTTATRDHPRLYAAGWHRANRRHLVELHGRLVIDNIQYGPNGRYAYVRSTQGFAYTKENNGADDERAAADDRSPARPAPLVVPRTITTRPG